MSDSQQYILPLFVNSTYHLDDFINSSSNQIAYDFIENWRSVWGSKPYEHTLLLYGPPSSGKTYIAKLWQNASTAFLIKQDSNILSDEVIKEYNAFIIEDIELWNEVNVLHYFNLINECKKYLLITTAKAYNNFALPDLSSRLNSVMRVEIRQPDDELIKKLIFKHFSDNAIQLPEHILKYLLINLPRQFDQTMKLLKAVTNAALVHKRPVTIALIKQVLLR
jgi:chromosomal replication initiation ATPase DnaA